MAKLILTRGIPASGKSTWAKAWVQEDPQNRVRVNRDDLRRMLYGGTETLLTWHQEQNVSAVEKAIAKVALDKGKDVVVDAMNLRAKWVREWLALGYPVEFRDFEVGLEEALDRNELRGAPLPGDVIIKSYHRLTNDGKLPEPPSEPRPSVEKYEPDWSLPLAILVDVDGTLAHIPDGGRSPYDYTRVSDDTVDQHVRHTVNELAGSGHTIIVMSGREDSCRADTEAWLNEHGVVWDRLYMRAAGDTRKDATVKAELFDRHIRGAFNVAAVLDDRNQVVRMWRDLGLKTFQVAEGAF